MRHQHLLFLLGLLVGPHAEARTWQVNTAGTGDAPTIQAAMDSATAGDIVLLAPGTYTEPTISHSWGPVMINMKPGVTLRGESSPESTVLQPTKAAAIFCFDPGEYVIESVTIAGGTAALEGGGIFSSNQATTTIARCIVRNCFSGSLSAGGGIAMHRGTIVDSEVLDNRASNGFGGGIASGGSLQLRRCLVKNNASGMDPGGAGGGVYAFEASVENCTFISNRAVGPFFAEGGGLRIVRGSVDRSFFLDNKADIIVEGSPEGGALFCEQVVRVSGCIFARNRAQGSGSPGVGGAIAGGRDANVTIERCTLVRNSTGLSLPNGSVSRTIVAWSTHGACTGNAGYSCTTFYGNVPNDAICGADLGGNLIADPQFCAIEPEVTLNFTLQSDSPCAHGNHPGGSACGTIGAASIGCSSVEVESQTWGRLKARYR